MILMKAKESCSGAGAAHALFRLPAARKAKVRKEATPVSGKVSQRYSDGEGKTDIYEQCNAELPSAAQQPGVSPRTLRVGGASGKGANTSSGNKASANPHHYLGLHCSEWQHWVVVKDATYDSSNKYIIGKSVKFDSNENIIGEEYYPYGKHIARNINITPTGLMARRADNVLLAGQTIILTNTTHRSGSQKLRKSPKHYNHCQEFTYDNNGRLVFVRERLNDGNLTPNTNMTQRAT